MGKEWKGVNEVISDFPFGWAIFFTGFGFHPERKLSKYCFLSQAEKYGIYLRGFFTDNVSASVQYTLMKRSTWNTKKKDGGKLFSGRKKGIHLLFCMPFIHTHRERQVDKKLLKRAHNGVCNLWMTGNYITVDRDLETPRVCKIASEKKFHEINALFFSDNIWIQ